MSITKAEKAFIADLLEKMRATPNKSGKPNLSEFLNNDRDAGYSLRDYTGMKYNLINKALRKGEPLRNDENTVNSIQETLKSVAPYDGATYRGTGLNPEQAEILKGLKKDDILSNRSFLSTSKFDDIADSFLHEGANKTKPKLKIKIDNNNQADGVDISRQSLERHEGEVLYPKESYFRVKNNNYRGDTPDSINSLELEGVPLSEINLLTPEQQKKIIDKMLVSGGIISAGALEDANANTKMVGNENIDFDNFELGGVPLSEFVSSLSPEQQQKMFERLNEVHSNPIPTSEEEGLEDADPTDNPITQLMSAKQAVKMIKNAPWKKIARKTPEGAALLGLMYYLKKGINNVDENSEEFLNNIITKGQ